MARVSCSDNRQGLIGWVIRLAIENATIEIFGDGAQLRDFVYVDDAADAFLRAGASEACNGEVFNIGGERPVSHRELTTLLIEVAGAGRVEYVEWPPDKKAIDIGSFYADSSKFKYKTGWSPSVKLREGLLETIAFYRANWAQYVDAEPGVGQP
jgi:UDP-glucose 4-epimerase